MTARRLVAADALNVGQMDGAPTKGFRIVPVIRFIAVTTVLALVVLGVAGCAVPLPVPVPFPDMSRAGEPAVPEGPALASVASLPVDASGEGTIQGAPTGAASSDDAQGAFVLVLLPPPAGLPPRTTVHVEFDHSTKVYRGNRAVGDPLTAMNSADGPNDADPTAAGTVAVRFHIKDGRVFADRLDLSDEFPRGSEP